MATPAAVRLLDNPRQWQRQECQKVATAAAKKIQARLVLGDLSLLEEPHPHEITLQAYGQQWLATDVALRLEPATVAQPAWPGRSAW